MTTTTDIITTDEIQAFLDAFDGAYKRLLEAAELLVSMAERDPDIIDRITDHRPEIPAESLGMLLQVGRREMVPELIYHQGLAFNQLRRLPYTQQEESIRQGVKVYAPNESGRLDSRTVPVDQLSREEVSMVFTGNTIRTLKQQQQWLANRRAAAARQATTSTTGPIVKKGLIEIPPHSDTLRLTRDQLIDLLAQMNR